METTANNDSERFDRLMDAIETLQPMPDRLDWNRCAAGTILKQIRERAGLAVDDAGRLYTVAYKRLFPGRSEGSAAPNTIRNWEQGKVNPQHGLRSLLALLAVYSCASRERRTASPTAIENILFLYGFRRLHLVEIDALFPQATDTPTDAPIDATELGSLRRFLDAACADRRHDDMARETGLVRDVAAVLAHSECPALRTETIDGLEHETRRIAGNRADPSEFMAYLESLLNVCKDPNSEGFITLLRMYADRLSGVQDRARVDTQGTARTDAGTTPESGHPAPARSPASFSPPP